MSTPNSPDEALELNLFWRTGAALPVTLNITDTSNNATISLTGAHVTYKANTLPAPIIKDSNVAGQVTIDAPNSNITLNFVSGDTSTVTPGTYDHECRVLLASGQSHTLFSGQFIFRAGVAAIP